MKIAVIGACGRVGLPFTLVLANNDIFEVVGIDINKSLVASVASGDFPYVEVGGQDALDNALSRGLKFTSSYDDLLDAHAIVVMMGTVFDEDGNPSIQNVLDFVKEDLAPKLQRNQVIIFRSTLPPETTFRIKQILEKHTGYKESRDFYLLYCPERVLQGHSIDEIQNIPQMIGCFSAVSFAIGDSFFHHINSDMKTVRLTTTEAEFAKLMVNTYRYITFAAANEFQLLANQYKLNLHKIIAAASDGYPRFNMPLPGPNVGGPCLRKDGKFFTFNQSRMSLIDAAYKVNESMPAVIFNEVKDSASRISVLGTTFKADNDDTRGSLSFKLKNYCESIDIPIAFYDPYDKNARQYEYDDFMHDEHDYIIIMTPHRIFTQWIDDLDMKLKSEEKMASVSDPWRLTERAKQGPSYIYTIGDFF